MTETKILSQPFEFSSTPPINYWAGVILIAIAITAGIAGFLHFREYFQLPAEFSFIPFEMLCGGIALFFFIFGPVGIFRFNGYRVDPTKQTIQKIKKGIFSTRKGEEILFNELNYVQFVREVVVSGTGTNKRSDVCFYVYIFLKKGAGKRVFSGGLLSGRVCSERLAKAVNVDLHDDSDPGLSQIRKPDELDKTVYEKLHQHFSLRTPPNTPLRMHSRTQLVLIP